MAFLKILKMFVLSSIGSCLTLCFIPIILPLLLIFYLLTICVKLKIRIKYKGTAIKATGQDVLFGMDSPKSFTINNLAIRFCGQMNVPKFKSRISAVIQQSMNPDGQRRYRRLTQTYCEEFGYNMWKDYNSFDIDQHIKVINLEDLLKRNSANEKSTSFRTSNSSRYEILPQMEDDYKDFDWKMLMKAVLNKFGTNRMSSELPQWQVFFLEEGKERYTMLFQFHHAISDGVYLARMLCEDFLENPTEFFHGYVPPSSFKAFLLTLWSFTLIPFGVWNLIRCNDKNVLHGPSLSGEKRFYLSNTIELDKFRYIKQRTKVGTHSIMFSCLSNALASHFARRSISVNDVTTLIPIPLQNLRKPIKLKNKFAVLTVKVPTPPKMNSIPKDSSNKGCSSLERLDIINRMANDAKSDPTFIAMHALITTFCSILPMNMAKFLLSIKGVTLAFSNLPGPQSELTTGDDIIDDIMFWVSDRDPLGAGISSFSYNGKLRVGLYIDVALLEDETEGDLLLQDFEDEVKNLFNELENQKFFPGEEHQIY